MLSRDKKNQVVVDLYYLHTLIYTTKLFILAELKLHRVWLWIVTLLKINILFTKITRVLMI
jgi:hypothetical protein